METAIAVGQIWRVTEKPYNKYEVVAAALGPGTECSLVEALDNNKKGSPFICSYRTLRKSATLVLPDIDWRTVAEGQAGQAVVCLKCGGLKPGRVFTCEPCANLEGTAKMALEWQQMMTAKRMAQYAEKEAHHAKWRAERDAEYAQQLAAGLCMNCLRLPTVPPGMAVAVRNQDGWCWKCHLAKEEVIASETNDPEAFSALEPIAQPLRLEPYDNRVAGIGAFGRIWRMR